MQKFRLKSIEFHGFKSFADKSLLNFPDGITAVVGPNGCGKSNIADAFRWVMGEQSAKSMRGSKMPDVIFAGTTSRKPLNFAEVTLTFDGALGVLPIGYEEVSITRRLHRSGDSDFLINNQVARLKDLQSLFLDAGLGKNAFAIFVQGEIDRVIQDSPAERRLIFEEAAGITRFLQKKRDALRRMEQVDQNLSRVRDIHREVETQITVLEEQAVKAREFREQKHKLEGLEKTLLVTKWDAQIKKGQELWAKIEGVQKKGAETGGNEKKLEEAIQLAKGELIRLEKASKARQEEYYLARNEREIRSRDLKANREGIEERKTRVSQAEEELKALHFKLENWKEEDRQMQERLKTLEPELAVRQKGVQDEQQKMQALEQEVIRSRELYQKAQQHKMRAFQQEHQLTAEMQQQKIRVEGHREAIHQLVDREKRLQASDSETSLLLDERKKKMQEILQQVETKRQQLQTLEDELQREQAAIEKVQGLLDLHIRHTAEMKARHHVLQALQEEMQGISSGSKKILQEARKKGSILFRKAQPLFEILQPTPGAEKAMAAALKTYANTVVVATWDDLLEILKFAESNKLKEFSLICLEMVEGKKGRGALLQKVKEHPLASHFLADIALEEDLHVALKKGSTAWCANGTFINREKVVFAASQGEGDLFLREAELKELAEKLKSRELELTDLQNELKHHQKIRLEIQTERLDLDKVIRKEEMTLVETNFGCQKGVQDLEKIRGELGQIESERTRLTTLIQHLEERLHVLHEEHLKASSTFQAAQTQSTEVEEQLGQKQDLWSQVKGGARQVEEALRLLQDEARKLTHGLSLLQVKQQDCTAQVERLKNEKTQALQWMEIAERQTTTLETGTEDLEAKLETFQHAVTHAEKTLYDKRDDVDRMEKELHALKLMLHDQESFLGQLRSQVKGVETQAAALVEELRDRFMLTIEDARSGEAGGPIETMEKQVRALRQQLDSVEDINLAAIEECEKHKVRQTFLRDQIGDLDQSKQELLAMIAELDEQSRVAFKQTFEQIRANFRKNFAILFQGGEADLQLTDSQDVLMAGVEIAAKPPGKQMRSITLLSGGEKCLTAMALLFGIFEVRPSPFCILDEIDAPLDDTNVERFVNMVKEFTDRCQFIIITHNKRTMAIADQIFGVSMQERGVSRLLTMEFSRAEALVEAS